MTARCGDPVCGGRCDQCVTGDNFWDGIDASLDAAAKTTSFEELVDAVGGRTFYGSGGDRQLPATLVHEGGWKYVYFDQQWEHHRYLKAPNGDVVEYCEGDLNLIKAGGEA